MKKSLMKNIFMELGFLTATGFNNCDEISSEKEKTIKLPFFAQTLAIPFVICYNKV